MSLETACTHPAIYREPLRQDWKTDLGDSISTTFAFINICARCRRPQGDLKMLKAGKPKQFNGSSWALMTQHHPHPPYHFKMNSAGDLLIPATYNEQEKIA